MRRLQKWFIGLMCLGLSLCFPALAQTKLSNAQLDQLMAPVALYPDALLSQILMGSTYPDDIAAAAKWSAAHTDQSGDDAVRAVDAETWDPSVKSLVAFPSVMDMMGREPGWVKSVGDAFLAQPEAVMDAVQRLRTQAQKAGNLKSTPQQTVKTTTANEKTVVVIEPADPQVVYVPSYNPTVVYGTWAYPSYPPYYYPPPPGSVFGSALVAGIAAGLLLFLVSRPVEPSLGSTGAVIAAALGALALVAAGLIAEHLCIIRKDDDDDPPGPPDAGFGLSHDD